VRRGPPALGARGHRAAWARAATANAEPSGTRRPPRTDETRAAGAVGAGDGAGRRGNRRAVARLQGDSSHPHDPPARQARRGVPTAGAEPGCHPAGGPPWRVSG
jgi:hypothetical protein